MMLLFLLLFSFSAGCSVSNPAHRSSLHLALAAATSPPLAERIPKADTLHDDIRIDDYSWLRDRSDPAVLAYLEAENDYTARVTLHTDGMKEKLYEEMVGRIKETDLSVPYRLDNYYYYSRTEEGKQYSIYCRRKDTPGAPEEIILDQNELASGHEYLDIGVFRISPNHELLAFSVDTTGSEMYTLHFKDLVSGDVLPESVENTGPSAAWSSDSRVIFYTTLDETERPYRVHRHELGKSVAADAIMYEEANDAFFAYVYASKDRAFIFLETGTHTTSEIHYLDAGDPMGDFVLLYARQHEIEYYPESLGDRFLILTNEEAKNFKLVTVPISSTAKQHWKPLVPHSDSVKIEGMDVYANFIAVFEREKGMQKMRIIDRGTGEDHYVPFPEPVYSFWMDRNPDYHNTHVRFTYTSLTTPRSIIDYHMDTRTWELRKQYEVQGAYDASAYASERIFAPSQDGTPIPISLVYNRDIERKTRKPLILYGYGAYGESYDPYFSSNRVSILDRGFIYAIAHVRGGGEMGRDWYDDGRLLNKRNSLTDFIACAEYLIAEGYTTKDDLVISGGSAGGLLIGGVLNMRPDLFHAAVLDVPFVDLLNTMLDPTLPLTTLEYDEWGNPNKPEYYTYMKSYAPYENIQRQPYPHMLIFASLFDTRVGYWESAKWVAKLRKLKIDNNILLLKTQMEAGHLGASGRYDYLRDIAFEYAFLCMLFNITE